MSTAVTITMTTVATVASARVTSEPLNAGREVCLKAYHATSVASPPAMTAIVIATSVAFLLSASGA